MPGSTCCGACGRSTPPASTSTSRPTSGARRSGFARRSSGSRAESLALEEVDAVGPQPLQRAVERAPRVRARAARFAAVVAPVHAELCREHHAVAPPAEQLPDQALAGAVAAVDVGGVEERHARAERGVDHGARAGAVESPAEVVAAKPPPRR